MLTIENRENQLPMKMNQKVYQIICIFLLSISSLNLLANKAYIQNFNRNEYNAGNKNWSISQDEYGIVYFGNDLGLLEFDGIKWELYKLQKNELVRAVLATSNKTIFTGGYEEFGRWDRGLSGKLEYTSLSDGLPSGSFHNDDIWKIWDDGNRILFQSFRNIFIYENKSITELSGKNILFLNKIYNEFWIQEMGGPIYKIINNKYVLITGSEIFSDTGVQFILPYEKDKYLIGTSSKGLFVYDGKNFNELQTTSDLINYELNCGILAKDGNYYIGTILNGIYVISPQGIVLSKINTDSFLQNNTVLNLYEDQNNNVWAALDKGIACVKNSSSVDYYTDPVGKIGAVYAAAIYNNKLFIGTNQGVFYTDYPLNIASAAQFKLLPDTHGQVWDFSVIDGLLYCGHNKGLKIINRDFKVSSPYVTHTGVFSITQDNDGTVILGTYNSMMTIDLKTKTLSQLDQIQEPITKVEIDHLDNVWLEHMNKGVYKCRLSPDRKRIDNYIYFGASSNKSLPYKMRLFKVGGRAAFLGKDQFYTFNDIDNNVELYKSLNTSIDGLHDLKNVININKNRLWIIGNNIIYKLAYDGTTGKIDDKIDLIANNMSLVNGFEKIVLLNDSISLVCLDNGFLLCNNNHISTPIEISKPYIRSFATLNKESQIHYQNVSESFQVNHSYNTITIRFSSKDTFSKNTYFQYKLEGLSEWSKPQRTNEVSYERLPKGEYSFLVRAVDRLGNQSEITRCNFEVLSPWYKTIWAYIAYSLIFIIIAAVVWEMILRRYRNLHLMKIRMREAKRLRHQNQQLQYQVNEKNAELLSQTSSIIQRNELILKIKSEVDDFHEKNNNKSFTPLFQKINILLNNNLDAEEDWKTFLIKFEEKHPQFFKYLKTTYPQLTSNDLKLCACLKLNLDSKEIASLMNISVRAVENSRYRLRKKLNIAPNQHLNDFFLNI